MFLSFIPLHFVTKVMTVTNQEQSNPSPDAPQISRIERIAELKQEFKNAQTHDELKSGLNNLMEAITDGLQHGTEQEQLLCFEMMMRIAVILEADRLGLLADEPVTTS